MRIARVCCLGVLLQVTAAGSCVGGPGDNEFRTYGPITVRSSGDGQLSTDRYAINVRTAGKLAVSYTAPRLHCASLRMHFWVDGAEKAVSGTIAPGQRTGYLDLGPVPPGNHVVALQAEGITGGCNVGRLTAWEGSADAWTTLLPGDHSRLRSNDLGPLVLEVAHEHHGDAFQSEGTYVTEDGCVHRYHFDSGSAPWDPEPHPDGEYAESDLLEKYGHHTELLGRVAMAGFGDIKQAANELRGAGSMPDRTTRNAAGTDLTTSTVSAMTTAPAAHAAPAAPAAHIGDDHTQVTDETTLRVYRRTHANGDYEAVLIAQSGDVVWSNGTADGIRLRNWLERISKPGGYEPVAHVACVTFPCPQPSSACANALHYTNSNQLPP